jgi:hypothetical protein
MSNKKFFRLTKFALIAIFSLIVSVQSNSEKKFSNPENSSSSSSWAKLNISPDTLGSMKYGNYRVDIYEHSKNQNPNTPSNRHKYYYAPIALLDHKSAISSYNKVTKNPEMKFRIEMWNQKVTEEMVLHLNKILGRQISEDQVEVIPLENVILVNLSPSSSFSLSTNWKAIRHHQDIWFTLSCLALNVCDQLAAEMRSKPEQFDHFKLLFSLSSQTSQTKQTVIRIETIASGQMVSDLLQKYGSETKEVFLTASDEKRMLTETATNIRLDTFDETEVGSSNSESQIYNMLKEMLISSKITIKEQSDKMWESVFWNDDNYRPDKTTQTLNNVYKKMDKISQEKLVDSYEHTAKENTTNEESHSESKENTSTNSKNVQETQSANVGGNVLGSGWGLTEAGISANYGTSGESCDSQSNQQQDKSGWSNLIKTDFASDFSRHGSTSSEGLNKFHEESKDHVQWDGEKFVPKPMQLSRINLAKFRDTQSFQDKKVTVRYTTAVLSTPINFVKYAGLTVTDEWKNLKEELQGIKAEFFGNNAIFYLTKWKF